jgi:hypothetical protein
MPTREIGPMGYVGEAVVGKWLEWRFAAPEYQIVRQVMPVGVPTRGGPYLDYAVTTGDMVVGLYEVKSQNVIWESRVNISLEFVWSNRGAALSFVSQDGRTFQGAAPKFGPIKAHKIRCDNDLRHVLPGVPTTDVH